MDIPQRMQQEMLLRELESARKHAKDMNERAVQVSMDIGKEKTQFFEKIAITNGSVVALIVGFVGSHAGRLQPPWLLRSALAAFVLSLVSATYRNWKFPFYVYASYAHQYLSAKLEAMYAKRDAIRYGAVTPVNEAGMTVSIEESVNEFAEPEKGFKEQMAKCKRIENRSFRIVQIVEYVTLGLFLLGMGMLVALAWRNF
jgi:hypothetical protein